MAHHPEIATDLEREFRRLTLIEKALQSADEQAALLAQFACDALHDIFLPLNKESLYLACTVQREYQLQRWTFANQKLNVLRSCKTEASARPRFVIHPDRELAAVIDSEVHILNSNQGTLASVNASPSNVGPVSWLGSSPDLALANGKELALIHIDEPWQDQWTAVPVVREQAKIKSIITDPSSTYCSIFTMDGQIQLYDLPFPK